MGIFALVQTGAACVPAAKTNLPSLESWQRPGSPQIATVVDAFAVSPTVGSSEGNAR